MRDWLTRWFLDALTATERSWVLPTGSLDERIALATKVADCMLRRRGTFAEPIG